MSALIGGIAGMAPQAGGEIPDLSGMDPDALKQQMQGYLEGLPSAPQ
jgi:hypothetical protein